MNDFKTSNKRRRRRTIEETRTLLVVIACHIAVFAALIGGGILLHHLLLHEGDPKLYDWVPWRYVVDTADLGLVLAFIIFGTISFIAVLRDDDD